jgi:hypothetical protein
VSKEEKEKLESFIELVDHMSVDPDVYIDYFIPGVMVTTDGGSGDVGGTLCPAFLPERWL